MQNYIGYQGYNNYNNYPQYQQQRINFLKMIPVSNIMEANATPVNDLEPVFFFNRAENVVYKKQIANNNPQMQGLISNIEGKNPKELEQYARNLAQSKGIDLRQFMNQYGINI